MKADPRMTYDNTYYAVDAHIEDDSYFVIITRGNKTVIVEITDQIHFIQDNPYITMRLAMQLGLITEFEYQKYVF